jgi:PIN domain nuclease of toxin-antitoxin system
MGRASRDEKEVNVVLDTHALLWWIHEPRKLGPRARRAISSAERVAVPAIVFWEVALLARKRRIDLGTSVRTWAADVLSMLRVDSVDLTAEIAIAADDLAMHDDPADRFIVATALHHGLPLVTRDARIRASRVVATIW